MNVTLSQQLIMLYVCADLCLAIYYSRSPRAGPCCGDLLLPLSLFYSFIIFYGGFAVLDVHPVDPPSRISSVTSHSSCLALR